MDLGGAEVGDAGENPSKKSFHLFDSQTEQRIDQSPALGGAVADPDVAELYPADTESHVSVEPWDEDISDPAIEHMVEIEESDAEAERNDRRAPMPVPSPMTVTLAGEETEEEDGVIQRASREPTPAEDETDGAEAVISISVSPSLAEARLVSGEVPKIPSSIQSHAPPSAVAGIPTFPILSNQSKWTAETRVDDVTNTKSDMVETEPHAKETREDADKEGGQVTTFEAGAAAALPKFPIFAGTEARLGRGTANAAEAAKPETEKDATPEPIQEVSIDREEDTSHPSPAAMPRNIQVPAERQVAGSTDKKGADHEEGAEEEARKKKPMLSLSQRNDGAMLSITRIDEEEEEPLQLELAEVIKLSLCYLPFLLLFLLLFTEVGFGATVFKGLVHAGAWSMDVAIIGTVLLFVMYCLDFSHWDHAALSGTLGILKGLGISFVIASVVISVALTFQTRPYAPLLSYLCGMCCCFFVIYRTAYPNRNLKSYLENLGFTIGLWGIAGVCASVVWAGLSDFWWGDATKREFRERLRVCEDMTVAADGNAWCQRYGSVGVRCPRGCVEVEAESACPAEEDSCLAVLLLWAAPFILSLLKVLMGGSLHVIAATDTNGRAQPELQNMRIYLMFLSVFILCIWFAASIASASPEVAEMVSAMAVAGLAMLFALLGCVVGFRTAGEAVLSAQLYGRIMSLRQSDWLRGALVLTVTPFFAGFLLVAFVNQRCRRWLRARPDGAHPLTRRVMTMDEAGLTFTAEAHQLLNELCRWNWTSVISRAIWWGFFYFVMQVGVSKWVTLFMAWLNIVLAGTSIWAVSGIIIIIAQGLFAIPVVPGVPAYIASGVIIGAAGQSEGWNFGVTMVWAIVVAQLCKQCACLVQQKVFGERMGQQTWVRSALGVNTRVTKAIKLILLDKGVTMYKVFVLVGGPDWPTSVLTGVLRIDALPCQLGTLPVLAPIALTVLAGGALTQEGAWWVNFSALLFTLSGAGLGGSFIFAFIAIEKTLEARSDEIDAMLKPAAEGGEYDEEIAQYETEHAVTEQVKMAVTAWPVLGAAWQTCLVASLFAMTASTAIFALSFPHRALPARSPRPPKPLY